MVEATMASDPTIDLDSLLEPIEGSDPSGDTLPFQVREDLEEARKEIDPELFDQEDPTRPTEFKPAEWDQVIRIGSRVLRETSKDMMVAARMTEALAQEYGPAGLRDGLCLLRRLCEEAWDRLRPVIEEPDDVERRMGPLEWLDDPRKGALFPLTIRKLALYHDGELGGISYSDWRGMAAANSKLTSADFEKVISRQSYESCLNLVEDLEGATEQLNGLTAILRERSPEFAPGLVELRQSIEDCRGLAHQVLKRKPKPEEAGDETGSDQEGGEDGAGGGSEGGGGRRGGGLPSPEQLGRVRQDIYNQLRTLADTLRAIEPHSPVPFLIDKSIEWGSMTFADLIRVLIRDETTQSELRRELGLPEPTPTEESY